tara:strand:- start:161 stop:451 length:291 start_codon:yes stop_codon:yes gene_type:complete
MITKSKQVWQVGSSVKVGFVSDLMVVAIAGGTYILSKNTQIYSFVPHYGLSKIDIDEARNIISIANDVAARKESMAISKASDSASHALLIKDLMFS